MQYPHIDNDECTYLLLFYILTIKRCEGLTFGVQILKT
jgi:hypothetical protein